MSKPKLENTCIKLYSNLKTKGDKKLASNYLIDKFAYPVEGSTFDKKQPYLKYIFRSSFFKPLLKTIISFYNKFKKYDGLFLYFTKGQDTKILSYLAFQKHYGNELHVFRIETEDFYRGRGFGVQLAEETIKYARKIGYHYVRLGKNNSVMSKILQNWETREEELKIIVLDENFNKGSNFLRVCE